MKTIKYKKIDEYYIYDGFDLLPEDPAESQKMFMNEIKRIENAGFVDFQELKQRQDIIAKCQQHSFKASESRKSAKSLLDAKKKAEAVKDFVNAQNFETEQFKHERDFKAHLASCELCNNELIELKKVIEPKLLELRKRNIAYAPGPRKNEVLGDQKDIESVIQQALALAPGDLLSLDFAIENEIIIEADDPAGIGERQHYIQHRLNSNTCTVIPDNRGTYYFKDGDLWSELIIAAIGEPVPENYIKSTNLTPDQSEEIRLQTLTVEQKDAEKLQKVERLAEQAVSKRLKLEIQGATATAAKNKATDWYNAQVAEVEAKYQ